jgi:SAM-dependent methyltransferase
MATAKDTAKDIARNVLYGRRYDHLPRPQQVYLRPGERQIRRALGFLRALRSRTVSLEAYRAATPPGEIEEFITCPLCGETRQRPLYRPRDPGKGWEYRVVRCPGCGFLYRNPNIRPERLGDLYATGYSGFLSGPYARQRQRRYRVVMDSVSPVFDAGRGRRLLDFGCGTGLFLELAEQRSFDAYGVDLSPDSLAKARQRLSSARVFHGSPMEVDEIAAGGFDVITMWSVLAHLPRPVADLSMLRSLLSDDGVLVILTVNGGSLHLDGLGSAWGGFTRNHLMFYSRDTLPRLLEAAGFAAAGLVPFYGDEVAAGESSLTPAEQQLLRRRVETTDYGAMLVAVGFATDAAADRWGRRVRDLRPRVADIPVGHMLVIVGEEGPGGTGAAGVTGWVTLGGTRCRVAGGAYGGGDGDDPGGGGARRPGGAGAGALSGARPGGGAGQQDRPPAGAGDGRAGRDRPGDRRERGCQRAEPGVAGGRGGYPERAAGGGCSGSVPVALGRGRHRRQRVPD